MQLLLLRPLHLRRHRQQVRPRLQGLHRRQEVPRQAVPVHRHLPRHVRPTVQEELGLSMALLTELAHLTQMYSTLHAINKSRRGFHPSIS